MGGGMLRAVNDTPHPNSKWDPERPGQHAPGDPDCECRVYRPEHIARLRQSLADSEAGRFFHASEKDFMAFVDGTLTMRDLYLRESLALTADDSPRHLEATP